MKLEPVKNKEKKRIGRGISAGQGKTSGRGTKGQKARAGFNIPNRYEGGQTPLALRLPKLPGFRSRNKKAVVVSLDDISRSFHDGETVTLESLVDKGLVNKGSRVKILNNGTLSVKVSLASSLSVSKSVRGFFSVPPAEEVQPKTK